jgi:hypothetical protein
LRAGQYIDNVGDDYGTDLDGDDNAHDDYA